VSPAAAIAAASFERRVSSIIRAFRLDSAFRIRFAFGFGVPRFGLRRAAVRAGRPGALFAPRLAAVATRR